MMVEVPKELLVALRAANLRLAMAQVQVNTGILQSHTYVWSPRYTLDCAERSAASDAVDQAKSAILQCVLQALDTL